MYYRITEVGLSQKTVRIQKLPPYIGIITQKVSMDLLNIIHCKLPSYK